MILSVSRRTDIPCYFSQWFYNKIQDGYVYTKNPFNPQQIRKIELSSKVIDCIVFWTKNPKPMINRLTELEPYNYYFQFTLTGYENDIEQNLPPKKDLISTFQELSTIIGKQKVVWRYDPIIFTKKYTPEYHLKSFEQIATSLKSYTQKCVISFVDMYSKIEANMKTIGSYNLAEEELFLFAEKLSKIAKQNQMTIATCSEKIDFSKCGIEHNCCIDKTLIEQIIGHNINEKKDKNQRKECGCIASVDIGTYNTCKNGCKYCYANYSEKSVTKNFEKYDIKSPLLCGNI